MEIQDTPQKNQKKPIVKVCIHETCAGNGSRRMHEVLCRELGSEAHIESTEDCFRFCKMGPNAAVDGAVLHRLRPSNAVSRIRREMKRPAVKHDAVGSRSIDELDAVLAEMIPD